MLSPSLGHKLTPNGIIGPNPPSDSFTLEAFRENMPRADCLLDFKGGPGENSKGGFAHHPYDDKDYGLTSRLGRDLLRMSILPNAQAGLFTGAGLHTGPVNVSMWGT